MFATSYEVPADEHMYRRVKSEIGDERIAGLVVHLVVKSDHGVRHIGVWESQADWERFRNERVRPAVGKVLAAAGLPSPPPLPQEQELQVVDVMTGG
jgi:hypothetical protein